ncbi:quinone oxidoreductase family protein [Streptomyces boncukensis]|uniref:Zinc-binding dehydrogenase n=1 Tax=Streptomyces boncukensis TaxID=2711219 RepID=A0A6G4X0G6_9ACTN|nr:zinc-binding dehydrogenase [Streptomyces boncukensis]NGO70743.1 zinc-binding dehydrogenase [Streptomyces boncukensis]
MRRIRHISGNLTLEDAPVPAPGPGELLVRTEAIGVTLPVVRKLREAGGSAPEPIGGEIAGTVAAVGPDVTEYAPGDRVTGLCFGDAYAEAAVLHTAMASAVPQGARAGDAVALVRGGVVALGALEAAGPRPGESALITAAAGGAGHLAVQLARTRGAARVVAAVSDPAAKGDFLRDLGADEVVAYDAPEGWPGPFDYVLDAVGGDLLTPAVRALRDGGRLVAYSSGGGTLSAYDLLVGGRTVTGFQIARIARDHPETYAAWRDELWGLFADGALRPAAAAEFPLTRAAEAHALIDHRVNLGRVVLTP